MSRIVTHTCATLDGVVQSPGRPDKDIHGGFDLGGWAPPYYDGVTGNANPAGLDLSIG